VIKERAPAPAPAPPPASKPIKSAWAVESAWKKLISGEIANKEVQAKRQSWKEAKHKKLHELSLSYGNGGGTGTISERLTRYDSGDQVVRKQALVHASAMRREVLWKSMQQSQYGGAEVAWKAHKWKKSQWTKALSVQEVISVQAWMDSAEKEASDKEFYWKNAAKKAEAMRGSKYRNSSCWTKIAVGKAEVREVSWKKVSWTKMNVAGFDAAQTQIVSRNQTVMQVRVQRHSMKESYAKQMVVKTQAVETKISQKVVPVAKVVKKVVLKPLGAAPEEKVSSQEVGFKHEKKQLLMELKAAKLSAAKAVNQAVKGGKDHQRVKNLRDSLKKVSGKLLLVNTQHVVDLKHHVEDMQQNLANHQAAEKRGKSDKTLRLNLKAAKTALTKMDANVKTSVGKYTAEFEAMQQVNQEKLLAQQKALAAVSKFARKLERQLVKRDSSLSPAIEQDGKRTEQRLEMLASRYNHANAAAQKNWHTTQRVAKSVGAKVPEEVVMEGPFLQDVSLRMRHKTTAAAKPKMLFDSQTGKFFHPKSEADALSKMKREGNTKKAPVKMLALKKMPQMTTVKMEKTVAKIKKDTKATRLMALKLRKLKMKKAEEDVRRLKAKVARMHLAQLKMGAAAVDVKMMKDRVLKLKEKLHTGHPSAVTVMQQLPKKKAVAAMSKGMASVSKAHPVPKAASMAKAHAKAVVLTAVSEGATGGSGAVFKLPVLDSNSHSQARRDVDNLAKRQQALQHKMERVARDSSARTKAMLPKKAAAPKKKVVKTELSAESRAALAEEKAAMAAEEDKEEAKTANPKPAGKKKTVKHLKKQLQEDALLIRAKQSMSDMGSLVDELRGIH